MALCVLFGCGHTNAARIYEMNVAEDAARGNPIWAGTRVLVRRFEDGRPPVFGKTMPTTFIIPLNLVHSGAEYQYAEHTGAFSDEKTVYVGWLPVELPLMLQRALPGDNAVVADDLPHGAPAQHWDYVVEGRILQTRLRVHNSVVMGMLTLFGTPTNVYAYEMEYEISVHAGKRRVFASTYVFRDRRAEGLWYHRSSARWLEREALRQTLTASATDVVREVTLDRARGS
jgi:hypothetical protein